MCKAFLNYSNIRTAYGRSNPTVPTSRLVGLPN